MIEKLYKIGISGGIGLVVGFFAVWWIEPFTKEGVAIIIVVSIIIAYLVIGLIIVPLITFFKTKRKQDKKKSKIWMPGDK